jgi:lysophospholipase L1-like esterase
MKRIFKALTSAVLGISLCSCGININLNHSSGQDITSAAKQNEPDDSFFSDYVSNTYIATGNNFMVESADSVTYRAYFPVEEYGELEYCFFFSNTVDSTYDDGSDAYGGKSGGEYTIESAFIAECGEDFDDITNYTAVTFDGSEQKNVSPDETFKSDPVNFNVEEGNYLVWEWTITGNDIPANAMSNLTKVGADYNDGKGLVYCDRIPLPQLIGAKRDVKYRIAAIGDSITQGCQTEAMAYEFWSGRISQKLGSEYSFWNCGLGWARTSDAALDGNWLERVSTADIVIVAFGTNDIISGEYGGDGGNTAEEIDAYLRTILDKLKTSGCSVIVFNAPPEDYREDMEEVRTEYNELLKETCDEYGIFLFDFASLLSDESEPAKALYGGHPNGTAGDIVSDEFISEYSAFLGVENKF